MTIIENSGEEDAFFDLTNSSDIMMVQQMLTNLLPTSPPNWSQFGFRGYGLDGQNVLFSPYVRVYQGVIQIFDTLYSNFYEDKLGLENFLREKAQASMGSSANYQILVKREDKMPPKQLPTSGSEPPYEPEKWNKVTVIRKNNCYAYATNIMGDSIPRPGNAGGKIPPLRGRPGYNCAAFVEAAESDGLVKVDCKNACPKDSFKVALVIKPNAPQDYHWYRQDDNGNWSHKPGTTEATNLDNGRKPIIDPQTADRGAYTTFCECFCVHPKKVTIRDVSLLVDVF